MTPPKTREQRAREVLAQFSLRRSGKAAILSGECDVAGVVSIDQAIRAIIAAEDAERERAANRLEVEAAFLRTRDGRLQAQWHEHDAAMVAGELDRQAAAIRNPEGGS